MTPSGPTLVTPEGAEDDGRPSLSDVESMGQDEAELPRAVVRWKPLVAIALAGFVLRLVMIFAVHPMCPSDYDHWDDPALYARDAPQFQVSTSSCITLRGDSAYLYAQGRLLADGRGFADPVVWVVSRVELPSARKPPGVVVIVAALARAGLTSPDATRVVMAMFGAGAVFLLAYLAWRLFGRKAGLLAAVLAALHPVLVTNDWRLLTESMAAFFFLFGLAAAYRLWERPGPWPAAAVGVGFSLCIYARVEVILLFLLILVPLLGGLRQLSRSYRIRLFLTMVLVGLVIAMPYFLMNLVRFNHPSPFGPGSGWGMMNASCDETWYGELTGYLSPRCFDTGTSLEIVNAGGLQGSPNFDESDEDAIYRGKVIDYIKDNLERWPAVMAARVGRVFGFYAPLQTTGFDQTVEERGSVEPYVALVFFYASIPFVVIGGVLMRRRRIPVFPMIAPLMLIAGMAAISFGLPRYRVFADLTMLLMVVAGLVATPALVRQIWTRRHDDGECPSTDAWWHPPPGAKGPVEGVLAASARDGTPRRVPVAVKVVVPVVAVVLAVVVGLSSAVEPDKTIEGLTEAQRTELCVHLEKLTSLVDQVGKDQRTAVFIPAELDAIDRLGTDSMRADVQAIRRRLLALAAQPASQSADVAQRANEATARLLALGVKHC